MGGGRSITRRGRLGSTSRIAGVTSPRRAATCAYPLGVTRLWIPAKACAAEGEGRVIAGAFGLPAWVFRLDPKLAGKISSTPSVGDDAKLSVGSDRRGHRGTFLALFCRGASFLIYGLLLQDARGSITEPLAATVGGHGATPGARRTPSSRQAHHPSPSPTGAHVHGALVDERVAYGTHVRSRLLLVLAAA
jgi:hypothetical protein